MIRRLWNRLQQVLWRRLSAAQDPRLAAILTAPAPEDEVPWTDEDRGALLGFLRSEAGTKLLQILRSREELLKSAACSDHERRVDHARGKAVGYRQAAATLIILSAPPSPPHQGEESAADSDRGAEALRQQHSA
jgi:hypothetical protein